MSRVALARKRSGTASAVPETEPPPNASRSVLFARMVMLEAPMDCSELCMAEEENRCFQGQQEFGPGCI